MARKTTIKTTGGTRGARRGPGRPLTGDSLAVTIEKRKALMGQLGTIDAQYLDKRNGILTKVDQMDAKMGEQIGRLASEGIDVQPYLTGMSWGPLGASTPLLGGR